MEDKVLIGLGIAGVILQAITVWQNRKRKPNGKHRR